MSKKIFSPIKFGKLELKNRIVMSPLTRSRADENNAPTDIMTTYYQQRAGAGLIITEGTAPGPNGLGYMKIPGMFSDAQIEGWRNVTDAVHDQDGKIFIQLMHTGRIGHPINLPNGAELLAPSAIQAKGNMFTPEGEKPHPTPREMTPQDIEEAINEHVNAAQKAIFNANFDGVEIHSANGYLLNQFLNPNSNQRSDNYGGSIENRVRFVIEVAKAVVEAIGEDKVGIRLSPYVVMNDLSLYDEIEETYSYLAKELGKIGLLYIHIVDHEAMGAHEVPKHVKDKIRENFGGNIILSGGYDAEKAEKHLQEGRGEVVAFGRPFIANPDLVHRMKIGAKINEPNPDTFYQGGKKGYIDYPTLKEEQVSAG